MIAPRIEIDLAAIESNAHTLVTRLARRGISVTGVTKATLGSADIAKAMLRGGVARLGDSRIENLEALRAEGIRAPLMLLRSPSPEQAEQTVASASMSLVSDMDVVSALSKAAGKRAFNHGIVLMVELGDLREGISAEDILDYARRISRTQHLTLLGLGTNLACRSGVIPGPEQMDELSAQVALIAGRLGIDLPLISGGNSANMRWAMSRASRGRINDLRLGEAILLGTDPVTGDPLQGLRTDAFSVVGAVIESRDKPVDAWGRVGSRSMGIRSPAGGERVGTSASRGGRSTRIQTLVALGRQDIDPDSLVPPVGIRLLSASSDHLVMETPQVLPAGTLVRFGVGYSSLLRAMTSPFVAERLVTRRTMAT